jgi:hypothetical protein
MPGSSTGPLFRPVKNNRTRTLAKPLQPASVYHHIVKRYVCDRGHQCPPARGRHRQGAEMARARGYFDDADV